MESPKKRLEDWVKNDWKEGILKKQVKKGWALIEKRLKKWVAHVLKQRAEIEQIVEQIIQW